MNQPNAGRPQRRREEAFGRHEPCCPLRQVDLNSAKARGMTDGKAVKELISQENPPSLMDSSFEDKVARIDRHLPGTERVVQVVRAHWPKLPAGPVTGFSFYHKSSDKAVGLPGATGHNSKTTLYSSRIHGSENKAASNHLVKTWNHYLESAISVPIDQTTRQHDKTPEQHRNQRNKNIYSKKAIKAEATWSTKNAKTRTN